ncbi:hypothetical protein [Streptomyces sp. NPDC056132]
MNEHNPTGRDDSERIPPIAGAVWCKACDSWCLPSGICRCNNR